MTHAIEKKSLKELAVMAATGKLMLNQFYAAAVAKNIDTERAERLLIETRERIEAEREANDAKNGIVGQMVLDCWRKRQERAMPAGKWIVANGGKAVTL